MYQPTHNSQNMRKYYQLLLFVVACISIMSFLFYKHEYERLRNVLEVLDIFGRKPAYTISNIPNGNVSIGPGNSYEPLPSWQRISDDFYIYSAFYVKSHNSRSYVKSIGVGLTDSKRKFSCRVLLDNGGTEEGRAYHYPLDTKGDVPTNVLPPPNLTKYKSYIFLCHLEIKSEPYSVQFYPTRSLPTDHSHISIYYTPEIETIKGKTALCVPPFPISSNQVVEFVAFHSLVEVDYFLFYDAGFDKRTRATLNAARKYGIKVGILPWNFPYSTEVRKLVESVVLEDCLMRTSQIAENAAVININEFLVPEHHHSLNQLFKDFDSVDHQMAEYIFNSKIFCTQFETNKKQKLNLLRNINYILGERNVHVYRPILHEQENQSISVVEQKTPPQYVPLDIATVHVYKVCSSDVNVELTDDLGVDETISKFQEKLLSSDFVKKWL